MIGLDRNYKIADKKSKFEGIGPHAPALIASRPAARASSSFCTFGPPP